ncbi:YdcH family protein [Acinetobacter rudis]|uniref:DUF465 domain-containing protein n=1 Tax=Acinetobacter rudis CIP 110305 TaxID=421052 RepID=S3MUQ6_9GAMM|nr:YdcH family protein [Acinetobacter rudis]EPF70293.1 hypothetical protein F945_03312 [Acinetobacter rudis CIP 110305]
MNIKLMNKKLKHMFPEYTELMVILKQSDPHFAKMLEAHDELDRKITRLELNPVNVINDNLEILKRQKLKYKDRLYALLRKAAHYHSTSLAHSPSSE